VLRPKAIPEFIKGEAIRPPVMVSRRRIVAQHGASITLKPGDRQLINICTSLIPPEGKSTNQNVPSFSTYGNWEKKLVKLVNNVPHSHTTGIGTTSKALTRGKANPSL